jgi:hypothetical protein
MLRRSFILFSAIALMALTWSSCTDDAEISTPSLNGRWEIEDARRNGRTTESLVDLYMVFSDDGSFETNLSGSSALGNYVYKDQVIETSNVPLSMDYQVTELTDSTLQLKSTYRNYRFDFSFQRAGVVEETSTLRSSSPQTESDRQRIAM